MSGRAMTAVLLLVALAMASDVVASGTDRRASDTDILLTPINMTAVAHHAGEAAVGLTCGAIGAWVMRKLQATIFSLAIMGSISAAAALHLRWVTGEQLHAFAQMLMKLASAKAQQMIGLADM